MGQEVRCQWAQWGRKSDVSGHRGRKSDVSGHRGRKASVINKDFSKKHIWFFSNVYPEYLRLYMDIYFKIWGKQGQGGDPLSMSTRLLKSLPWPQMRVSRNVHSWIPARHPMWMPHGYTCLAVTACVLVWSTKHGRYITHIQSRIHLSSCDSMCADVVFKTWEIYYSQSLIDFFSWESMWAGMVYKPHRYVTLCVH